MSRTSSEGRGVLAGIARIRMICRIVSAGWTIFAKANTPSPTEVTFNRIYPSVLGVAV